MQQTSLFKPPPRDVSVRVGPAGWDYKDWQGAVYPSIAGRSLDGLAFLADYFDTIEINSSFYRPPRAEDATAWMRRVQNNPRFKFTAKAWQRLSHERKDTSDVSLGWECDEVRRSMVENAERLPTLEQVHQYVAHTLSRLETLEPDRFPLTQQILNRSGKPCGIYYCLQGPRAVRLTAIWETEQNTILFYGSCGRRMQRTRLLEAPSMGA